jgi:hypothetical protein
LIGLGDLAASDRIFVTPARTKVLVIDPGIFSTEIRLLDGPYAGSKGVIHAEFVHKE